MLTIVIVGNSQTRLVGDRMLTPRGYAGKYDLGSQA
jgi:precorrin-3B C17-methyltransferase